VLAKDFVLHNGAAESLAAVVSDPKHRTDNGRLPDVLSSPADQAALVSFLESIDVRSVPFVPLDVRLDGASLIVGFASVPGVSYEVEGRPTLDGAASLVTSVDGTGARVEVPILVATGARFFRLVNSP